MQYHTLGNNLCSLVAWYVFGRNKDEQVRRVITKILTKLKLTKRISLFPQHFSQLLCDGTCVDNYYVCEYANVEIMVSLAMLEKPLPL